MKADGKQSRSRRASRLRELATAAMAGDGGAALDLAVEYDSYVPGDSRPRLAPLDYGKAAEWYEIAVRAGNSTAMVNLAYLFYAGLGVPKSPGRALALYKRAARLGNATGAIAVAATYRDAGRHRAAYLWYQRAARMGDDSALLDLAIAELYGQGTRKNAGSAIRKLNRVARSAGVTVFEAEQACILAARLYVEGWAVRRSLPRTLEWLERPIASDSAVAKAMAAEIRTWMAPGN